MKRVIGLLMVLSMFVSVIGLSGTFAFAANPVGSVRIVDDEYYFEDFSGYTGGDFTIDNNGYYQRTESNGNMSLYQDTAHGNALKITNNTTKFTGGYIDGPRGTGAEFKLSRDSFENKEGATLVYSYDVYIKQPSAVQGSGIYGVVNANKKGFLSIKSISTSPMYTNRSTGGNMIFAPVTTDGKANWTGGNTTDKISADEVKSGKWYKMQSVIKYDATAKEYVTTYFVDGEKITNNPSGEASTVRVAVSDTELVTREYFGVSIAARNNSTATTEDYFIVDNMALYQYGATEATLSGTLEGKTISIPLSNKYAYTDMANVPSAIKTGYGDISTYTGVKISVNGGAAIAVDTTGSTADTIKVNIPDSVGMGDKVAVVFDGVRDIAGNAITLSGTNSYTVNGGKIIQNKLYKEDFSASDLNDVKYNLSKTDGTITAELTDKGKTNNGIEVKTKALTRGMSIPYKAFNIDAESFENASNKAIVYGYDVYIPANAQGMTGSGYLTFTNASGGAANYISDVPAICSNATTNSIWFQGVNFTENGTEDGANYNGLGTRTKVKLDYATRDEGKWVNLKSMVTYENIDGEYWYVTRYFVDGKPLLNADKTPAIYKAKAQHTNAVDKDRTYIQLAINANSGKDAEGNATDRAFIYDNISIELVDLAGLSISNLGVTADGTASFSYSNMSTADQEYQLIIVGYNSADIVVASDISQAGYLYGGTEGTVSKTISQTDGIVRYDVYLWKNLSNIEPLLP